MIMNPKYLIKASIQMSLVIFNLYAFIVQVIGGNPSIWTVILMPIILGILITCYIENIIKYFKGKG